MTKWLIPTCPDDLSKWLFFSIFIFLQWLLYKVAVQIFCVRSYHMLTGNDIHCSGNYCIKWSITAMTVIKLRTCFQERYASKCNEDFRNCHLLIIIVILTVCYDSTVSN